MNALVKKKYPALVSETAVGFLFTSTEITSPAVTVMLLILPEASVILSDVFVNISPDVVGGLISEVEVNTFEGEVRDAFVTLSL